jgi:Fe2+ or Zn2+ uptake regulation protein
MVTPMTPCAANLFEQISRRGERLTRTRRAVVEALCAADGPACVRALHAAAGAVDLVTVYRALHWLVELGLAREVVTGNAGERYELVDGAHHVHHLHCEECGKMFTVPVCGIPRSVFGEIEANYRFAVDGHRLTFHGRCAECRGPAEAGSNGRNGGKGGNGNSRRGRKGRGPASLDEPRTQ